MERREFLKIAGVSVVSPLLQSCSVFDSAKSGKSQPNILFIFSDEHHPTKVGYRGHPHVKTPNLDRIAQMGAHFTRAYCNSPICGASRPSMMMGKFVNQIDVWHNSVTWPRSESTWAKHLDRAGYHSVCYGKMDTAGLYQNPGFSEYRTVGPYKRPSFDIWPLNSPLESRLPGLSYHFGPADMPGTREQGIERLVKEKKIETSSPDKLYAEQGWHDYTGFYDFDRTVTDWTLDFLRQKGRGLPWAIHVGYLQPHWPYICPKKYFDMYYSGEIDMPHDAIYPNGNLHPAVRHFQNVTQVKDWSEDNIRKVVAAYYGMITCMDDMIGEILDELENQGLLENTYIIYSSDHGEGLGEHGLYNKLTAYEASVGVPLTISGPGISAGERIDTPVSLVDIYPTIMEIANLSTESDRPGSSLLELIRGEKKDRTDYVFSEYHACHFRHDWYMLVRGDYKYIYYAKERPSLFNVREDPLEMNDLAQDPKYTKILKKFEKLLRSICNPDEVARRSKSDLGLIGPNGEDYTETLTWQQLLEGRRSGGMFPPAVGCGWKR